MHATNIFSSYNVSALIIFPQTFKNLFEVLVPRCITAGKAMKCRMNRAQIRPFQLNDSSSF